MWVEIYLHVCMWITPIIPAKKIKNKRDITWQGIRCNAWKLLHNPQFFEVSAGLWHTEAAAQLHELQLTHQRLTAARVRRAGGTDWLLFVSHSVKQAEWIIQTPPGI